MFLVTPSLTIHRKKYTQATERFGYSQFTCDLNLFLWVLSITIEFQKHMEEEIEDNSDDKCPRCGINNASKESLSCPYDSEIYGEDNKCYCCDDCRDNCSSNV